MAIDEKGGGRIRAVVGGDAAPKPRPPARYKTVHDLKGELSARDKFRVADAKDDEAVRLIVDGYGTTEDAARAYVDYVRGRRPEAVGAGTSAAQPASREAAPPPPPQPPAAGPSGPDVIHRVWDAASATEKRISDAESEARLRAAREAGAAATPQPKKTKGR